MAHSAPIPIPWRVRWRELQRRFLPAIVFLMALTGAAVLWRQAGPGGVPGIAEAEQTLVSAPQSGVLTEVLAPPFQFVATGQAIAVLQPQDPRASFDLLQAELALGQARLQPTVAEENAMNFERIRVEFLRTKSELAIARVNLVRAEQEVERYTPLHEEKLVSDDLFELRLKTRDALKAEVEAKQTAVELVEQRLTELSRLGVPQTGTNQLAEALLTRLDTLKNQAESQLAPITLRAPRSGLIHFVHRQTGENVVSGEPLFSISPLRSERIVAYLRQPYSVNLQVGMKVEVATREYQRRVFLSEIAQVGARIEPITNSLAIMPMNALIDAGLPFVVHLPININLRPGEVVDLRFPDNRSNFLLWRGI
jgi:HlyD family secretion protein